MTRTALFLSLLLVFLPIINSFDLSTSFSCGGDAESLISCGGDNETSVVGDFRTSSEKLGDVTNTQSKSFNYLLYGSIGFVLLTVFVVLVGYDLYKKRKRKV